MNPDYSDAWHPSDGMIRDSDYDVPDDQFARYVALTPLQRLRWLDEACRFTLLARAAMREPQPAHAKDAMVRVL